MRKSPNPICAMADCSRPTKAKNFCALHYRRFHAHGDPNIVLVPQQERTYVRRPEAERFWEKVEKTDSCWLWIGAIAGRTGYGSFSVATTDGYKRMGAHRWSYEHAVGPVPAGLVLDHLCCVRHCVNPAHLEPVTYSVNALRGTRWTSRQGASA